MAEDTNRLISLSEAATVLGDGVTESHVQARVQRGSLEAEQHRDGTWCVWLDSVEQSLDTAPPCSVCGERFTEMVIVKYPHHDRVEFELCGEHAAKTALAYARQGQVLEVVTYPYQSEGWLKPHP